MQQEAPTVQEAGAAAGPGPNARPDRTTHCLPQKSRSGQVSTPTAQRQSQICH